MEWHEAACIFPMMDEERLNELVEDIKENGQQVEIELYDNKILDGRNRYRACMVAGVEPRFCDVTNDVEPLSYVLSMNLQRRHLDVGQRAFVALNVEEYEAKAAKERQSKLNGKTQLPVKLPEASKGDARDKAAEQLSVSGKTVSDAKAVAQASPELAKLGVSGKLAPSIGAKIARAASDESQLERAAERIEAGEKPTKVLKDIVSDNKAAAPKMEGVFQVIYADPPWQYTSGDQHSNETQETVIGNHYPSMPLADICDLPVDDIADEDCVLFMWTTSPLLEESFEVIKEWGFKYKASMIWDKVKHNVGHYVSVRHELLLIATKGSPPKVPKLVDSVYEEPRTQHSRKPGYFSDLIVELYPDANRVELFRRGEAPQGWSIWGNEAKDEEHAGCGAAV